MKTVLLLGAGRISAPFIDYLSRKGNCKIVVADISSDNLALAERLSECVKTVHSDAAC